MLPSDDLPVGGQILIYRDRARFAFIPRGDAASAGNQPGDKRSYRDTASSRRSCSRTRRTSSPSIVNLRGFLIGLSSQSVPGPRRSLRVPPASQTSDDRVVDVAQVGLHFL